LEYVKLGGTGLEVSRLCLGCMSFGEPAQGSHPWSLGEQEARPLIERALQLGINFFDTANVYSAGSSEEILGRALADLAPREDVVIATKVNARMRPGPNGAGLSRKAIITEIDASLRRLGTDYVDLYQIHRWDPTTPLEETLEALDDVVKAGKALYIGASSMFAWQFSKALYTAAIRGWTQFSTMQNHYNLLDREEEREMIPLCLDQQIGVIPWSPLARGLLARDWEKTTARSETDRLVNKLYKESDRTIVERAAAIARTRDVPMGQVALSWVAHRPGVVAPIVGATKLHHIEEAAAAIDMSLSTDELELLEEPYTPRSNVLL
jgi:aryl-alcohol dehydrogenase-like predicted oxidoreductase